MQRVKKKIDFTQGKVFLKIIWFVLPIVATNLLQMFYNAADMMVVSLSTEKNAVGAIGITGSFISLVINVFIGFAVGANVVVAREIGAKNRERTQKAVHTALLMGASFGLVGTGIGLAISRPVLRFMGAQGSLLELAVTYTCIYFAGVPFLAIMNYLISIFRAKGDAKTPLIVLAFTGLLNVGLNLFFVLCVKLSVEGVAIATATANAVSVIILMIKLYKDNDYTTFRWRNLKLDREAFRDIVKNGLPAGVQGALFSLSNVIIQSSIVSVNNAMCPPDRLYDPIVNGSSAAGNIDSFVYTTMNAVYQGAITVTSQNMGADKPHRVKRVMYCCMLTTTIIGVFVTTLVLIFKEPLLALYGIKDGAEGTLEHLAMYAASVRYKYVLIPYFLCGLMEVMSGVLRGMGKSFTSMIISLIGACLLRVIWLWTVFPAYPTLEIVFVSYPITWLITMATAFTTIQILLSRILKARTEKTNMAV